MTALELLDRGRLRPLSRAEYDRMVENGVFGDERLELLYGALVRMNPQAAPHAYATSRLAQRMIAAVGDRADVRVQCPLALSLDSEPEPDIALVPLGDYRTEHPSTALLVIEVADSSIKDDRLAKGHCTRKPGSRSTGSWT